MSQTCKERPCRFGSGCGKADRAGAHIGRNPGRTFRDKRCVFKTLRLEDPCRPNASCANAHEQANHSLARQFKNLGSMSLSEKRVHFSGTCARGMRKRTCVQFNCWLCIKSPSWTRLRVKIAARNARPGAASAKRRVLNWAVFGLAICSGMARSKRFELLTPRFVV